MDRVTEQYEAFPYPERDPRDEKKRLITGSPSDPMEVDHFVFGGRRDWSKPFRALFAGGGTGDGMIQMAQKLADAGCPADITWLDMSSAAREIAEARAKVRGLGITFLTGDLMTAPDHGPFDYIDCCGVLHHLPDPQAGFDALARALAPDGGMGFMVYAPHGRTGVYPLQAAFDLLLEGEATRDRIEPARAVLNALPDNHWFRQNAHVEDHRASEAGLYDLLLHARDTPFYVADVLSTLDRAGLDFVSFTEAAVYDPSTYLPDTAEMKERLKRLDPVARMSLAEHLAGHMKTHIAYAVMKGRGKDALARPTKPDLVPHLNDLPAAQLAQSVAKKGEIRLTIGGINRRVAVPGKAASLIAQIDGRSLGKLADQAGLDWFNFSQAWGPVHRALCGYNLLRYSRDLR